MSLKNFKKSQKIFLDKNFSIYSFLSTGSSLSSSLFLSEICTVFLVIITISPHLQLHQNHLNFQHFEIFVSYDFHKSKKVFILTFLSVFFRIIFHI